MLSVLDISHNIFMKKYIENVFFISKNVCSFAKVSKGYNLKQSGNLVILS